MPIFVGAGTSSFAKGSDGIGFTRLNTTQRDAISGPVSGQVIFNTSTGVLEYYDGSSWAKGRTAGRHIRNFDGQPWKPSLPFELAPSRLYGNSRI